MNNVAFNKCESSREANRIAKEVVSFIENHPIKKAFQNFALALQSNYKGIFLPGPYGHSSDITEDNFQTVFPYFLQIIEIFILATATNKLIEKYPEVLLTRHFHDGNVICAPIGKENFAFLIL